MLAKTNQTGPQTSLLWLLNLLGYLGSGRSPGGGHGNSLQYSCLGNLMDRSDLACTICNPILGVVGVGWFSAVSSQLSTLLVAEGASGQHITASTTSPCFSHEKICKSPKKDKNIVSIFCTFKMLIDMAKFLFRNLEPIYTSISNEQRGPWTNLYFYQQWTKRPISQPLSHLGVFDLWKLSMLWGENVFHYSNFYFFYY